MLLAATVQAADSYQPPTESVFRQTVRRFPYVADGSLQTRLRTGVPQLRHCMDDTQIRALLGPPDFGYVAFREGTHGTVPEVLVWHYVLSQQAATQAETDSQVVTWFNTDRRLVAVSVYGIQGLPGLDANHDLKCL